MKNGLILFLILNVNFNLYSFDSINAKIDKNFYKFLAVEGIVLTGAITYLKYQWYNDKERVYKIKPVHDFSSHPMDALRCLATGIQEEQLTNKHRQLVADGSYRII